MPQTVVVDGQKVAVVSYEDLYEYFCGDSPCPKYDTMRVWTTFIVRTVKVVTAIHLGCLKKFGECECPDQLAPNSPRYKYTIAMPGTGRASGVRREQLCKALQAWVVPREQLGELTLHKIDSNSYDYRHTVLWAAQALTQVSEA